MLVLLEGERNGLGGMERHNRGRQLRYDGRERERGSRTRATMPDKPIREVLIWREHFGIVRSRCGGNLTRWPLRAWRTYLDQADPLVLGDAARRERQRVYIASLDVERVEDRPRVGIEIADDLAVDRSLNTAKQLSGVLWGALANG